MVKYITLPNDQIVMQCSGLRQTYTCLMLNTEDAICENSRADPEGGGIGVRSPPPEKSQSFRVS